MYEGIRKERLSRMHQFSRQGPANNLNNQSRTIAFIAIFLFALAGLISGFSVGAFVRPTLPLPGNNANTETNQPSTDQSQTATHNQHPQHLVKLGWPVISQVSNPEAANSNTTYTLSAYAVDQSIDTGHGKAVHASGITFKLWLVHRIPANATFDLPVSTLENINAISSPVTGTVQNQPYEEIQGLSFTNNTPQTQQSNAQGKVTWKYQVVSSLPPGDYDLVILSDWDGKYYNWFWINIEITH